MTATRIDLARPTSARAAAVARPLPVRPAAPAEDQRPDLRLVPPPRTGPRRGVAIAVVTLVIVCASLLGTAVLHTMLVSGQRQVDQLDDRIRTVEQANQARRLTVSELESPVRVVAEAERAGMIRPDEVTWLTRNPDGSLASSRTERPAPSDG